MGLTSRDDFRQLGRLRGAGNGAPRDANGPPGTPTRPKAPEAAKTRFDAAALAAGNPQIIRK